MPYIEKIERNRLEPAVNQLLEVMVEYNLMNAGQINYLITTIMKRVLDAKGTSYKEINALVGALECAKMEMYRRVAVQYEERKALENGDVY